MEMRKQYGIEDNNSMVEILFSDGGMLVRKYEPACFYCGSVEKVTNVKDTRICQKCLDKLN
jgi:transcriptional pleiotropic regulator of transition state genes